MAKDGRNAVLIAYLAREIAMGGCCASIPSVEDRAETQSEATELLAEYVRRFLPEGTEFMIGTASQGSLSVDENEPKGLTSQVLIPLPAGEIFLNARLHADSVGLSFGSPHLVFGVGASAQGIPSRYHLALLVSQQRDIQAAVAAHPRLDTYAPTFGGR